MSTLLYFNRLRLTRVIAFFLVLMATLFSVGLVTAAAAVPATVASDANEPTVKPIFTDLASNSPLLPHVRYLVEKGIIKGFPDGTFRPAESLTRAEAARVIVLAKRPLPTNSEQPTFSDVPSTHWAFAEIEAAVKAGLIKGYPDGSFNPEVTITRAEAIALLLRLSGGALSGKTLDISDIGPEHWAYRQVATAVEAGLVELSADKSFNPDQPFRRGDLATGLSALFTLAPSLREADLVGKLTVKKGKATITTADGKTSEAKSGTPVGAGAKITTDEASEAEIAYDDGSGILLEENAEILVTDSRGFSYMKSDGSPAVAVDRLVIKLKNGKIFGALASRYTNEKQPAEEKKPSLTDRIGMNYIALASTKLPADLAGILLAEADNKETDWWNEPYAERERVVVDMPWGVAGIRGTFWMNSVSSSGQSSTALIIGHAVVTSGGQTVSVTAGQSTAITTPGAPPAPPAALTQSESQAWATVANWVTERAQQIQNSLPPPPAPAIMPPTPVVQQQQQQPQQQQQEVSNLANIISQSLAQATAGVTAPATTNTSHGGNSSTSTTIILSVSAVNGTVTARLSAAPSVAPTVEDFTVSQFVYVGPGQLAPVSIPVNQLTWDAASRTCTLNVPPLQPGNYQYDFYYTVGYKGGTAVQSNAIALPAIASVSVYIPGEVPFDVNTPIPVCFTDARDTNGRLLNDDFLYTNSTFSVNIVSDKETVPVKYMRFINGVGSTTIELTTTGTHTLTVSINGKVVASNLQVTVIDLGPLVSGAVNVALDNSITVTFNVPVFVGAQINNITFNESVLSYTYSVSGNDLIITPLSPLNYSVAYSVYLPSGVVKNAANVNNQAYTFSLSRPTESSTNLPLNNINVPLDQTITVNFDMPVFASSNFSGISISPISPQGLTWTCSISDSVLTISHTQAFGNGIPYVVHIPAGAVKNSSNIENTTIDINFYTLYT